jgi:ParB-like chromosome segregation protein Spo0J
MLKFRPHEYSLLLPAMSEQNYAKLKDSIAKNGLIEEIVLHDGQILDGVHRDKACRELRMDISTRYTNWDDLPEAIKSIGPLAYVYAKNIPRRHMTVEQLTKAALDMMPRLEAEARERQLAGRSLASSEAKGKAAAIAAPAVGVSTSTVERALRKQREAEQPPEADEDTETAEPEIEDRFRELAKDVRDMISKVLHHHADWSYGERAWLCSKAASKLAALARELSKHKGE